MIKRVISKRVIRKRVIRKTVRIPMTEWFKIFAPGLSDIKILSVTNSVIDHFVSPSTGKNVSYWTDGTFRFRGRNPNGKIIRHTETIWELKRRIECDGTYPRIYNGYKIDPETGDFVFTTGFLENGESAYYPLTNWQAFMNRFATLKPADERG